MRQQQLRVTTLQLGLEGAQDWPRKDNKNEIINLTGKAGRGKRAA